MPRIDQPGTPPAYTQLEDADQVQAQIQQQGMAEVPDRLHAIAALSDWDCFTPIIESITSFFNHLIESCFACLKQIGVALGCISAVDPVVLHMIERWVTPYRTKAAETKAREAAQEASISKLALELAKQEGRTLATPAHAEQATEILINNRESEIRQIAQEQAANAFKCMVIAKLLATKATGEEGSDPTPYLEQAERIRISPQNDIERAQQNIAEITFLKERDSVSHTPFMQRAKEMHRESEVRVIAQGLADLNGGDSSTYVAQAKIQYDAEDFGLPLNFDASWKAVFDPHGDGADLPELFWADFQQLPEALKARIIRRVKIDDAEMVTGFTLRDGISTDQAAERVLKAEPSTIMMEELERELNPA